MTRKTRVEADRGYYHVINRGNYRTWVFAEEGAKMTFETTLFECCERAGWVLHAFCIMGNHYHLAVETDRDNLIEGIRWLQSTFANRFNRHRKESGHLFQGRFKSLAVEYPQHLAWLCHYINLNPVRARICGVEDLNNYRWSSYWYLAEKKQRPAYLTPLTCLEGAGDLPDSKGGWRRYTEYLESLVTDIPAQKEMGFKRMSQGWAIGTKEFQTNLVINIEAQGGGIKLIKQQGKEALLLLWEYRLQRCLQALGKSTNDIKTDQKAAAWKVAVAAHLKQRFGSSNKWLGEHLNMGISFGVSRYITEMHRGHRVPAEEYFNRLTAKLKD